MTERHAKQIVFFTLVCTIAAVAGYLAGSL